jgi:predicted phosphodiesterase
MSRSNKKVDLVLQFIKKYNDFPNKSAIAGKLFEEYPLVFSSKEEARFILRYALGKAGDYNDKRRRNKIDDTMLPQSVAKKTKHFYLPSDRDRILVVSDIHFPNQDNKALASAIQMGIDRDTNCIIILGDLLDNTPFSSYDHPPSADDARRWFEMVELFLIDLRFRFPNAAIIWAEGNHDNWYERWLIKKAPMIFDDPYYKLTARLKLDDKDVTWIPQKQKIFIDGLILLHGHTLIKGFIAPVNAARGLFLKAKESTMIGHVHQSHSHTERTLKDKLISCFSLGCLCTLEPDYDPHNTKHAQGWAFVTRKNGNFYVENYKYHNGQVYQ